MGGLEDDSFWGEFLPWLACFLGAASAWVVVSLIVSDQHRWTAAARWTFIVASWVWIAYATWLGYRWPVYFGATPLVPVVFFAWLGRKLP